MNIPLALLLSAVAGLSTGIGSTIAHFMFRPRYSHLGIILGFSAGVMVYISFAELLPTAVARVGLVIANGGFFTGLVLIALLDVLVPHQYKEEQVEYSKLPGGESPAREDGLPTAPDRPASLLARSGMLTALGIAIHNFPEGLVVFASAASDIQLGILVAIAVALHNIPEGISISVPIIVATGNYRRAFWYSFSAGLAEPVGALAGYAILLPFLSTTFLFSLMAFAAGIMVYISLDELLPAAHRYGQPHFVILGVGAGMAVMALSLILVR